MAFKYLTLLVICFYFNFASVNALQAINGRIKITIGTTSGCSDTVTFIRSLAEAYELYGNYLDIEFVPWGRSVRRSDGSVTCQFGPNDCWANRLHRCALNSLSGDMDAQVQYMICEFSSPLPAFGQTSYYCAQRSGLRLVDVDYCVNNPGDHLDTEAEIAGTALTQAINFIPSIVFNDQIDMDLHNESRIRLLSMICFALAEDPSTGVTDCSL